MSGNNNALALRYNKCPQIVSKVVDETEELVVWHLKDWSSTWQVLRKHASCWIGLGGDMSLLFTLSDPLKIAGDGGEEETWLSLLVQPQYASCEEDWSNKETCFKFQVDELKDKLNLHNEVLPATYLTVCGTSPSTLVKKFIDISGPYEDLHLRESLFFGITVINVSFKSEAANGALHAEDDKPGALETRKEHTSSSNSDSSDLVWVTSKFGEEFEVRKAFLEKSKVLKERIEKAENSRKCKKGSPQIHVNCTGDVMQVIFHWLKSREFAPMEMDEDFEYLPMSLILATAKELEMVDLIEYIDINMSSYCTFKNKQRLLQAAKAFSLHNAARAIAIWTRPIPAPKPNKYLQYCKTFV